MKLTEGKCKCGKEIALNETDNHLAGLTKFSGKCECGKTMITWVDIDLTKD